MSGYFEYVGVTPPALGEPFSFQVASEHLNGGGSIHGGMSMTLAELVCRRAVSASLEGEVGACISLNCDFISGARKGETIACTAEITRQTNALVFVSAKLTSGERTVMTANGLYAVEATDE